ncbi:hypothetical protein C1645_873552 [Glomus cerebriforme]|uniref:F-box domain-containing protein n=1 Tax=Glomus cerebriforme TaxID=658196 RepID=A0A397T7Q9_9GLOM|nr:hypothetical protein C1645_873552 [Glomus cerebriforme]
MEDCFRIIFTELQEDSASLYSCILVNRFWCRIAVPILWKNIFIYGKYSRKKLYNVIIHLLPQSSKQLLFDNNIDLPSLSTISNKPLFNYISYLSRIYPGFIDNMIQTLIKREVGFNKFQEDYKRYLLEQEIYKLFIKNCNNIKEFSWRTEKPLFQYPGASIFFSHLCSLGINLHFVTSSSLFGMAQICQNIEELNIHDCYELSEVIERKSSTLKKFTIRPIITLLSPKFLPSLINLQYLELNNDDGYEINGNNILIEKSQGNLLEINIYRSLEYIDPIFNKKLINAIIKYCPKVEKLMIDVDPKNLDGIKEIFLNCRQLRKVYFSTNNQNLVCDELLEIIVKFSSRSLYEFAFDDNWNFSVSGLQSFFENWKGRIPLIFHHYFCEQDFWTEQHDMIVKKYREEGVVANYGSLY